jgi:tetratricopeptide (TPR) repeat protein
MVIKGRNVLLFLGLLILFISCSTPNQISKVQKNGKIIVNDCISFREKLAGVVEANKSENLVVSNSPDFNNPFPYSLEGGQFEQLQDTVFFRLNGDLDYSEILVKGLVIEVLAKISTPSGTENELGIFDISDPDFKNNNNGMVIYKFPFKTSIVEKKILLFFRLLKTDSKGRIKKYFCESDKNPIGPVELFCCSSKKWETAKLLQKPVLSAVEYKSRSFQYGGFTAVTDVGFMVNAIKTTGKDPITSLKDTLSEILNKGYKLDKIKIKGYSSLEGKLKDNLELSEKRAAKVKNEVEAIFGKEIIIESEGMGEDWDKIIESMKNNNFSNEEISEVKSVVYSRLLLDDKEKKLKTLPCWKKIEKTVLKDCRHVDVHLKFNNTGIESFADDYPDPVPLNSQKLRDVANSKTIIGPYKVGDDIDKSISILRNLLFTKKEPSLYALRSTYYQAKGNYVNMIADLKASTDMDPEDTFYKLNYLNKHVSLVNKLNQTEKLNLTIEYDNYYPKSGNNQIYLENYAILLTESGRTDQAIEIYGQLLENSPASSRLKNNYAIALAKSFRIEDAINLLESIVQNDSCPAEAYYNLGALYAYRGKHIQSIDLLQKSILCTPANKEFLNGNTLFRTIESRQDFIELLK